MKPYYQDAWVTIYHGDCREILPGFHPDVIVTDPPYKDEDVDFEYLRWFDNVFRKMRFITKDYILFFNNSSRLYDLMQICGKPVRILVWSKGVVKYAWRWEPILIYGSKEPSFKINKHIYSDHLPFQPLHKGQSQHKYEKPIKLMNTIISFIPLDKVILDPFLGSGTTAVAAKKLNRKCIGIEIEEKYCEIAAKRCSQGVFELGL